MKIEQLAHDKVKVTLSDEDLISMKVDPMCFLSDTTALNGFIINLMSEIHKKTDFNPYQGNITMEAQHDSDGMTIMLSKGMPDPEMLMSKAQIHGIMAIPKEKSKPKRKIKSVKAIKAKDKPKRMQTFEFDDFENMTNALMRMNGDIAVKSEVYKVGDKYFVLVPTNDECLDDIAMIMEFADDVKRGMAYEHIREHGEYIASKDKLLSMIDGIKTLNTD